MGKNPLDFCRNLVKIIKKNYKNRQVVLATILLIIMGCFFYSNIKNGASLSLISGSSAQIKDSSDKEILNLGLKKEVDIFESVDLEEKISPEILAKIDLENEIKGITRNHPIEEMAPFIAQYDNKIAALIVGIAKKESDWGFHSPSKNGKTCYNYWGYKGAGSNGVAMGYSCFNSPEEAVSAIGNRIEELVNKKIDTPQKMVVWKCGSSCAGHDPAGVKKWISDVSIYYNRITKMAS